MCRNVEFLYHQKITGMPGDEGQNALDTIYSSKLDISIIRNFPGVIGAKRVETWRGWE